MSLRDILRAISLSDLTDKERADLRKVFETRRRELQRALAAVERGLAHLGGRGAKKAAKRRAKKR